MIELSSFLPIWMNSLVADLSPEIFWPQVLPQGDHNFQFNSQVKMRCQKQYPEASGQFVQQDCGVELSVLSDLHDLSLEAIKDNRGFCITKLMVKFIYY